MSRLIADKDKIDTQTINKYDEIDGLHVIEEFLLTKGEENYQNIIPLKELESMALVCYGLKVNATNKLNVGIRLDKYFLRQGMMSTKRTSSVITPKDIWERVKGVNDQFRKNKVDI